MTATSTACFCMKQNLHLIHLDWMQEERVRLEVMASACFGLGSSDGYCRRLNAPCYAIGPKLYSPVLATRCVGYDEHHLSLIDLPGWPSRQCYLGVLVFKVHAAQNVPNQNDPISCPINNFQLKQVAGRSSGCTFAPIETSLYVVMRLYGSPTRTQCIIIIAQLYACVYVLICMRLVGGPGLPLKLNKLAQCSGCRGLQRWLSITINLC